MVEHQIARRGVCDERVLQAMRDVPREAFLQADQQLYAYEDRALAAGWGQTISQPYIVALMTELLQLAASHRVLEIGTGTGYQTALLAVLCRQVYTIERIEELSERASKTLIGLGHGNIEYRVADGTLGWPEASPFDRIIVTAAAPAMVEPLVSQLAEDGRLVIPVGEEAVQRLTTIERRKGETIEHPSIAVRFVKLIGEAGFPE